jgi:uncharacterized protein (TIGR03066 family)
MGGAGTGSYYLTTPATGCRRPAPGGRRAKESGMKTVSTVALAVVALALAGAAKAQDDNAKKIVGVWVVDKAEDLPAGATVEFTKDGKMKATVKEGDQEIKIDGTYKVEKDKLMIELKIGEDTVKESVTIKKLTDDVLEVEDKDNKVTTFKKKK